MRYWRPRKTSSKPCVGIGVASYLNADPRRAKALDCLIASFQAQTYQNWKMMIVHDGPCKVQDRAWLGEDDDRVRFNEMPLRLEKFGHPYRQIALDTLAEHCEWLLLTNEDNYYAPVFLEWLVDEAIKANARFVYCDMVHSHRQWQPMTTHPVRKKLDLGGCLVHRKMLGHAPFDNFDFAGDADWIGRVVAAAKGRVKKVNATLFVHN